MTSPHPEDSHRGGRIRLDRDGAVAVLTIDRPHKLNAFTLDMVRELETLSRQADHDPDIRCLVVTGSGDRAFSAGGDLASLLPATLEAGVDVVSPDPARRFFSDVFTPVIAAVRGVCIGGGLELMLGSDLRIVGSDARFGLGEVRWGLIPGAGTHARLPRQIPWAIAMQLLLTGDPIDAVRAYEVGLVNEVVAPESVLDRALEVAHGICANAPIAVRTAKEAAVRGLSLTDGFVIEHALNTRVLRTADAVEGTRAFQDKRQPRFTGR